VDHPLYFGGGHGSSYGDGDLCRRNGDHDHRPLFGNGHIGHGTRDEEIGVFGPLRKGTVVVEVAVDHPQQTLLYRCRRAAPANEADALGVHDPLQFEKVWTSAAPGALSTDQHLQGEQAVLRVDGRERIPQRIARSARHFDQSQPSPAAIGALFVLQTPKENLLQLLQVHAIEPFQTHPQLLLILLADRIDSGNLMGLAGAPQKKDTAARAMEESLVLDPVPYDVLVRLDHDERQLSTRWPRSSLLLEVILLQRDQPRGVLIMETATVQEGQPITSEARVERKDVGVIHPGGRGPAKDSREMLRSAAPPTVYLRGHLPIHRNAMLTEAQLERCRLHVRKWFAAHMPRTMHFHDLEHTMAVTRTALALGQALKLDTADLSTLEVAALFHDTGYAKVYQGHEEASAELARAYLQRIGANKREIARVAACILSTRSGATPRNLLQRILRDADSAKAGQIDFIERSEKLRKELELVRRVRIAPAAWLKENIAYLEQHRFHTTVAQRRYSKQKGLNLDLLLERGRTPKKQRTPIPASADRYFDRDLSWLSFNDRVLQEAMDRQVPLLERLKFLAIYSNNLDEFYRVRVASLRSLAKLKKVDRTALEVTPEKRVDRINRKAMAQQERFGRLYREELLPALAREGIHFRSPESLTAQQAAFVQAHFKRHVAPLLHTATVRAGNAPFIEDRKLYFACRLKPKGSTKQRLVLVNIPSDELGRFIVLPTRAGRAELMYLDDAMRMCLATLFTGFKLTACHAIKLSRDAELHLDEEYVGNVKDKVRKSLRKRSMGVPSRFLYDREMPRNTLRALRNLLGLSKQDLVAGGRYHNFSDLLKVPLKGYKHLRDAPLGTVPDPVTRNGTATFQALKRQDVLWHFPYHDFGNVLNWLNQAARDPKVKHISITLYRVAEGSEVCKALLTALERGKRVTVFVEVQARFDERSNLFWGETLEKAGAHVLYSYENLKVHCKLCSVERSENGRTVRYAYLGTGNFNERTSTIYTDMALLTAQPALTREVAEVFKYLADRSHRPVLSQLLMAPLSLRGSLEASIDKEIEHARTGVQAGILLKLNSLEDRALIRKLYDASHAGVQVRLIIRGICCLVPGVQGLSSNIEAISIVDRFLEHTRVYAFVNGGKPTVMLSSADWMGRNLDRRVEVAFPVTDPELRTTILELMEIQWKDRSKARKIDVLQTNPYRGGDRRDQSTRTQQITHHYLKQVARKRLRVR
jgi:polyphosphate kinase